VLVVLAAASLAVRMYISLLYQPQTTTGSENSPMSSATDIYDSCMKPGTIFTNSTKILVARITRLARVRELSNARKPSAEILSVPLRTPNASTTR